MGLGMVGLERGLHIHLTFYFPNRPNLFTHLNPKLLTPLCCFVLEGGGRRARVATFMVTRIMIGNIRALRLAVAE
jgi:hypothetical protein